MLMPLISSTLSDYMAGIEVKTARSFDKYSLQYTMQNGRQRLEVYAAMKLSKRPSGVLAWCPDNTLHICVLA